jgi:DNA-directed RNA polymerase specialized sigma24 family protein
MRSLQKENIERRDVVVPLNQSRNRPEARQRFFIKRPHLVDDAGAVNPEALRQAMQRLPRGQREAIEIVKLREMSLREAAAATGLSIAALKVAVHRGMNALRKALATES